ncbi:hypothetical protein CDV31_001399 [Fusarium ambrosium]|uniref:Uncharacterized protein n=1 Tax=Fusarium ambrosium TaxID=131363 RepID=A0A428UZN6_9HYPO|nr:hypothetical protein CDV31_001399 [Fusarium ambrosium]
MFFGSIKSCAYRRYARRHHHAIAENGAGPVLPPFARAQARNSQFSISSQEPNPRKRNRETRTWGLGKNPAKSSPNAKPAHSNTPVTQYPTFGLIGFLIHEYRSKQQRPCIRAQ